MMVFATTMGLATANLRGDVEDKIAHGRLLQITAEDDADCIPKQIDVEGCSAVSIKAKVAELNPSCLVLEGREEEIEAACAAAKLAADAGKVRSLDALFGWKHDEMNIFMDGHGAWNTETDGISGAKLATDAKRVASIYQNQAQDERIPVPAIDNFHNTDDDAVLLQCELNAMMCCWARDRQANDNNGHCATPEATNCVDADPADNTDICYADSSRAPPSTRVEKGFHFYGQDQYHEGETHCHGLAWDDNVDADSYRFAGNVLFYVSFYDHLYQRGYVQNIPGAPMCGCLEQMPTVSRSDCTQADVTEKWRVQFKCGAITGLRRLSLAIDFNACDGDTQNDLYSEIAQLYDNDVPDAYSNFLVGPSSNDDDSNCFDTIADAADHAASSA